MVKDTEQPRDLWEFLQFQEYEIPDSLFMILSVRRPSSVASALHANESATKERFSYIGMPFGECVDNVP